MKIVHIANPKRSGSIVGLCGTTTPSNTTEITYHHECVAMYDTVLHSWTLWDHKANKFFTEPTCEACILIYWSENGSSTH